MAELSRQFRGPVRRQHAARRQLHEQELWDAWRLRDMVMVQRLSSLLAGTPLGASAGGTTRRGSSSRPPRRSSWNLRSQALRAAYRCVRWAGMTTTRRSARRCSCTCGRARDDGGRRSGKRRATIAARSIGRSIAVQAGAPLHPGRCRRRCGASSCSLGLSLVWLGHLRGDKALASSGLFTTMTGCGPSSWRSWHVRGGQGDLHWRFITAGHG